MFPFLVEGRSHLFLVNPFFRLDRLHQAGCAVEIIKLVIPKRYRLFTQSIEEHLIVGSKDECRVIHRISQESFQPQDRFQVLNISHTTTEHLIWDVP